MAGAAPLDAGGAKEAEEEKKKKEKKRGRSSDSRRVILDAQFSSGTGAFFWLQAVRRIWIRLSVRIWIRTRVSDPYILNPNSDLGILLDPDPACC